MTYRESTSDVGVARERTARRSLVVWGRIENNRAILEPAFLIDTRPLLPTRPGPYRVEGTDIRGNGLFSLSFDATPVADAPQETRHFVFAVPIGSTTASELARLRLMAPVGSAEISAPALDRARLSSATRARRIGGGVEVVWDAVSASMIMVRDGKTGEVVGLARGGRAELPTRASSLEIHVSDGVSSRRVLVSDQ